MTRKLATVRKIKEIKSIPKADKIVAYRVDGWWVVDSVDKYVVGDLVVYAEPDSFMPTAIAPFLTRPGHYPKTFEGIEGERLRTVKLRGQLSQGLLLPLSIVPPLDMASWNGSYEGTDVSEMLGIAKYEAPVPACLAGDTKGLFPRCVPKTDQERVQNLFAELEQWKLQQLTWEVTEKCEGSSFTALFNNGEFDICSRNLTLKENDNNTFWATAAKYDLKNKLTVLGRNIAIQAELLGPGVQGNIYKLSTHMLAVFDIFDIDQQQYMCPVDRAALIEYLGLTSVPVLAAQAVLSVQSIDTLLIMANGHSVMGQQGCKREGLVWKCNEQRVSFKAISNDYLLGEK